MGSCDEKKLLEYIKAQGGAQGGFPGHAPAARGNIPVMRGKVEGHGRARPVAIEILMYGVESCMCAHHKDKKQLSYRDEMVGTQLVAGAVNKDHQAKVLSESASLLSLEDKLKREV